MTVLPPPSALAAAGVLALLVLGGPSGLGAAGPSPVPAARSVTATDPGPGGPVAYAAPIAGPVLVVAGFVPPPTPYAAGHRGVDLRTVPGQTVFAAAAGRVGFAGTVAGRGVVTIEHADGVLTEYEPVRPTVSAGTTVRRGQPIGTVAGRHRACAPGGCLHGGARRGSQYFDPLTLLRPLGPVRLLPWPAGVDP